MDEKLTEDDTALLVDELIPAQNKTYHLALELKIEQHDIQALDTKWSDPSDKLLQMIILLLQRKPESTRRDIVNALKSPKVNLITLAKTIEEKYPAASSLAAPLFICDFINQ